MQTGLWAVIVARVANGAKSRLSPALGLAERQSLVRSMLARVVDVCTSARVVDGVMVVSDDAGARLACEARGAVTHADPHPGDMNAAVRLGLRSAAERGAHTAIVLPADIPLLSWHDLDALVDAADGWPRAVVVGASRDGQGTNALFLRPLDVILPGFGPPSVDRHVEAGRVAGAFTRVLYDLDLALDVDTPADLAALAQSAARAG